MTPAELSRTVLAAVRRAVEAEELPVTELPRRVVVQRPQRPGHGDYASNAALQLARSTGRPAAEVAGILARRLEKEPGIARVEVAAPGFLNITLSPRAYGELVRRVRELRGVYGTGTGLAECAVTMTADDPRALRAPLVAETVNRLLRAAGAHPGPAEPVRVQEPLPAECADHVSPAPHAAGVTPAAAARIPPAAARIPPAVVRVTPPAAPASQAAEAGLATPQAAAAGRAASPAAAAGRTTAPATARAAVTSLITTLGPDAARWALLRPPAEDAPRLADAPALLVQREENPLFRVRYAHARTRALLRNAHDLGIDPDAQPPAGAPAGALTGAPAPDAGQTRSRSGTRPRPHAPTPAHTPGPGPEPAPAPAPVPNPDPTPAADPYHHPAETELLGLIADFPRVVETAARRRAPDRLARHLERVADAFGRFHDECPPLPKGPEKPSAAHAARVRLADATGVVLAGGLHLLGISAPDHL